MKQIINAHYIGIVVFMFVLTTSDAQVITLDSVLRVIDRQNPMLQEYAHRINALNAYSEGATNWMAPMVGAGTFMTPYRQDPMMMEGDKGAIMFSVEQDIPNPAKSKASKNFLQSKANVEQHRRAFQLNSLRAEAKQTYYEWLVLEEKMRLFRENQQIVELMIKLAQIRNSYNQGSVSMVYKAEGVLSEVQNMQYMTKGEIEDKNYRLKTLMNAPVDRDIMIDTTTNVVFNAEQVVVDTSSLVSVRSDVKEINQTIQVMQLNQRFQQSQAKPDFKIRFDHMQPLGDMPSQFTAMAMVSIPIAPWSSKMYRSEVKGMQYDIEAMKKGREAILLEARGMLAGMASQLKRMKQQLENYDTKIIPALTKNYQTLMIAYEQNREQLPMVIDAWEAMNMAQMEYLNKKLEYYLMIVNYEKQIEK